MLDPYEVIGVSKTSTDADIKTAYRKLAKKYHPDLNPNNKEAEKKFKEINTAYRLIENKEAREKYKNGTFDEEFAKSAYRGGPFYRENQEEGNRYTYEFEGDPDDILKSFFSDFGGFQKPSAKGRGRDFPGQDHLYKMEIDIRDAVNGAQKEITLQNGVRLNVKIPPGIDNGEKLRFKGQGGPGIGKGKQGDAYVEILIKPDNEFKRNGNNLEIKIPVTLDEIVNSAKILISTLDGSVMLNIPEGVNNGAKLRIKEKGMTMKNGKGRGDLIVILELMLPDKFDPEFKEFISNWSKKNPYNPREKD